MPAGRLGRPAKDIYMTLGDRVSIAKGKEWSELVQRVNKIVEEKEYERRIASLHKSSGTLRQRLDTLQESK